MAKTRSLDLGINNYWKLYPSILLEYELESLEYLIVEDVRQLSRGDKWCWKSRSKMAATFGKDVSTIKRTIKKLVARKLLVSDPENGRLKLEDTFRRRIEGLDQENRVAHGYKFGYEQDAM